MPVAALSRAVEIISVLGSLLVLLKLITSGLFRRYRIFFLYWLFLIPYDILPLVLSVKSDWYFYCWVVYQPIIWILYIWVTLELYRLILENHRGLYSLGRWVMYLGVAVSVAASVLSLVPKITPAMPQTSRAMYYYLATGRGVTLGLVTFLVLMFLFLSRYPVPMSRNLVAHLGIFTAFFFSTYLAFLLRTVFGLTANDETDLFFSAVAAACIYMWFFLLTPKGEEVRATLPSFGPEFEQRALRQLETLNATLLKASKK